MTQTLSISPLRDAGAAAEVAVLVWAFFDHLRARYPERVADIDAYIAYQDIDAQLANWRAQFTPPDGECLLARLDAAPVGIVMLRRLDAETCEMNRMFVTDAARGRRVGRALGDALIERARDMGFASMRLDAWDRHQEALPLYASLGFDREWVDGYKPDTMTYEMIHMRRAL